MFIIYVRMYFYVGTIIVYSTHKRARRGAVYFHVRFCHSLSKTLKSCVRVCSVCGCRMCRDICNVPYMYTIVWLVVVGGGGQGRRTRRPLRVDGCGVWDFVMRCRRCKPTRLRGKGMGWNKMSWREGGRSEETSMRIKRR